MSSNLWNEAKDELKTTMKKEVGLMREVLSNLHQEELNLLMGDQKGCQSVLQQRTEIVQRLAYLRQTRMDTMEKLKNLIPPSKKNKEVFIDKYLALDDESYSEIILIQEQFSALIERIKFQTTRNEHLAHDHKLALNHPQSYNQPHALRQKKKGIVATCEKPQK